MLTRPPSRYGQAGWGEAAKGTASVSQPGNVLECELKSVSEFLCNLTHAGRRPSKNVELTEDVVLVVLLSDSCVLDARRNVEATIPNQLRTAGWMRRCAPTTSPVPSARITGCRATARTAGTAQASEQAESHCRRRRSTGPVHTALVQYQGFVWVGAPCKGDSGGPSHHHGVRIRPERRRRFQR